MFVGVCRITLHLHGNESLKGKRSILRRICERTRNKFSCAVAEVGANDALQRAVIGAAVLGNSGPHVDAMLARVMAFVEGTGLATVVQRETEVLSLGEELAGSPGAMIGLDAELRAAWLDEAPGGAHHEEDL